MPPIKLIILSLLAAVVAITLAVLACLALRKKPRAQAPKPKRSADRRRAPVSLAVLLARPLPLDEDLVASAVQRAFGSRPTHDEHDAISFAGLITESVATVQIHGNVLAVISIAEPYAKDRDWYIRSDSPPEFVEAYDAHHAWLSIDLVYGSPRENEPGELDRGHSDDIYALIGKLLVELAGGETGAALIAFRPATRHAILYDDETRTLLRRTNPLKVVTGPLTSLVLLESAPRSLDTAQLRAAIAQAWHEDLPAAGSADFAAVPEPGYGVIAYEGLRFGVLLSPTPYVEDLAAALDAIADLRLRQAVAQHKSWISIDMIEAPVGVARARVYDLMARLLAEFLADSSLLLYAPGSARALPVEPALQAKLRARGGGGESVLALLSAARPPVVSVESDDPRMAAAVAEARRRLPEFLAAFQARRPDQHFAVKHQFEQGLDTEFMWIRLAEITPAGNFSGTLDNEPFRLKDLKIGDPVSCPPDQIVDWLYTDGPKLAGNFTATVLTGAAENSTG